MAVAGSKYRQYLYGGEGAEQASSSLYSGVSSPFKPLKFPEVVNNAVSSPESTEDKLTLPRVDLLSKFRNSLEIPQDNTRTINRTLSPTIPRMEDNTPEFPTTDRISKKLGTAFDPDAFTKATYKQESNGDYKALNKAGGGAGAVGKYQFRWNIWKDDIAKVTGLKDRESFRNSPKAQEQFYTHYLDTVIKPSVDSLSKLGARFGLTPTEVGRVIHFQGVAGARKALTKGTLDRATTINPSINEYLGKSPAKKK